MNHTTQTRRRSRPMAILQQRCPMCLEGKVFKGIVEMHENCPVCGWRFGREPGYFVGAMYFSYGMAFPFIFIVGGVLWWFYLRQWSILLVMLLATLIMVPFTPSIFRYSRILWMHLDILIDPPNRK